MVSGELNFSKFKIGKLSLFLHQNQIVTRFGRKFFKTRKHD